MSNTQGMVCPNCRQSNFRKISGIIAQGTSTAEVPVLREFDLFGEKNSFIYETTRDITQVSNLAQRLQWPSDIQPVQPPRYDLKTKVTESTLAARTSIGWLYQASRIGILLGLAILVIGGIRESDGVLLFGAGLAMLALIVGVLAGLKLRDLAADPQEIPNDVAQRIETNLQNAPEYRKYLDGLRQYESLNRVYQRKVEKYSRLYYCYVCDAIFDPQDSLGRVAPPEQMAAYLAIE